MVRVLVTVEPRMYREAIALAVQRNRPDSEVMLVSAQSLDGQLDGFEPHVLVRNDSDGEIPEELLSSVVCRMEVLFTDHMAARVSLRGDESYTIEDASLEDLHALVDEAEEQQGCGQPRSAAGGTQVPSEPLRGRGSGTARGLWWRRMLGR